MFNKDRDTGVAGDFRAPARFTQWPRLFWDGRSTRLISLWSSFCSTSLPQIFTSAKPPSSPSVLVTLAMRPVGALIFGLLTDRYGRRIPLMANVIFFSVVELLCGFSPNLTFFLMMRALYGIGMGGEWGIGASLAMESVPPRWRGILSGILQSGYSVGYLLAAIVARFVLPDVGLAADVLAGRRCRRCCVLYQRSRAGIGSVEAASRAVDGRGAQDRGHAVEEFSLSRVADDVHDVSFARHAGPVSGFPRHRAQAGARPCNRTWPFFTILEPSSAQLSSGNFRRSWAEESR